MRLPFVAFFRSVSFESNTFIANTQPDTLTINMPPHHIMFQFKAFFRMFWFQLIRWWFWIKNQFTNESIHCTAGMSSFPSWIKGIFVTLSKSVSWLIQCAFYLWKRFSAHLNAWILKTIEHSGGSDHYRRIPIPLALSVQNRVIRDCKIKRWFVSQMTFIVKLINPNQAILCKYPKYFAALSFLNIIDR